MQHKKIILAEIIANSEIAPDHFLMQIKSLWLAQNSIAGQFVAVKVQENSTDPLLRIPLAIHSINKDSISLLYKVIGNATKILGSKRPQQIINILGPLGNGFDIKKNKQAILVAGGYAVSPLYALAQTLVNKNNQVTVFIGAYSKQQILCEEKFIDLGAQVHVSTEDGSQGYKGYVTELLKNHISKLKDSSNVIIYAAGPLPMLSALTKITKQLTIPTQLSLESYMACGIGVCRGCVIPTSKGYKLCCKDGPVFDARMIEALL